MSAACISIFVGITSCALRRLIASLRSWLHFHPQ